MKNEVVLSSEIPPETAEMEPRIIENDNRFVWNVNDMKTKLSSYISKYTDLVVTEDNLKDMEAAQKEIAGVRIKIDGFRKDVKKKLEEPYKQFETEIKELQVLIEQAEKPLKEQIAKYEEARVVKLESELLTFAENTSNNLGLRPEYVGKFSIQSAWTKKAAKITATRKAIVTEIENLLSQQKNDDEAEQLRQQRTEMIRQYCEVHSQSAGLKTPLLPCDVGHLVAEAPLPEISGIIIQACHDRLNLEQKAAREAAAVTEPPMPPTQPSFQSGPPPMPPIPPSFQSGPPPTPEFIQVPPPPMPPVMPALWDVDMRLLGITLPQAAEVKAFYAQHGIKYKVISQTVRGNG